MPSNAQLASYKAAYRVSQCEELHSCRGIASAIEMGSTVTDEVTAGKLKAILPSDNTFARRKDLYVAKSYAVKVLLLPFHFTRVYFVLFPLFLCTCAFPPLLHPLC